MGNIKFVLVLIMFLFITSELNSQIGIELMGNKNVYTSWNDVIYEYSAKESKIFKYSYGVGINYWFRLHNYRLEFTPGIYYQFSQFMFPESECDFTYNSHVLGVEFDMNIYPFDFVRRTYERDCPSFSHNGEWFKKSFFLQVSPGVLGALRNVQNSVDNIDDFNIAGKFDFGVGVDMKLSSHIIIAPIVKYGIYIGEKWDGFSQFHAEDSFNDGTTGNYVTFLLGFYLK